MTIDCNELQLEGVPLTAGEHNEESCVPLMVIMPIKQHQSADDKAAVVVDATMMQMIDAMKCSIVKVAYMTRQPRQLGSVWERNMDTKDRRPCPWSHFCLRTHQRIINWCGERSMICV